MAETRPFKRSIYKEKVNCISIVVMMFYDFRTMSAFSVLYSWNMYAQSYPNRGQNGHIKNKKWSYLTETSQWCYYNLGKILKYMFDQRERGQVFLSSINTSF